MLDGAFQNDPGIHIERLVLSETIVPARKGRDWGRIVDRALSFIAGALVGVLLALFLLMSWR
jgi:uncharacterized membrane protein YoaK (UPF0700 family)